MHHNKENKLNSSNFKIDGLSSPIFVFDYLTPKKKKTVLLKDFVKSNGYKLYTYHNTKVYTCYTIVMHGNIIAWITIATYQSPPVRG